MHTKKSRRKEDLNHVLRMKATVRHLPEAIILQAAAIHVRRRREVLHALEVVAAEVAADDKWYHG